MSAKSVTQPQPGPVVRSILRNQLIVLLTGFATGTLGCQQGRQLHGERLPGD